MALQDLTPERRREISSLGGKALKPEQRSFTRNRQLASEAGKKGGLTPKKLGKRNVPRESVAIEEILSAHPTALQST